MKCALFKFQEGYCVKSSCMLFYDSIKVPEAELSAAVQRGDETVVFSGKSVSLLTGLLFSGHYDHIISRYIST